MIQFSCGQYCWLCFKAWLGSDLGSVIGTMLCYCLGLDGVMICASLGHDCVLLFRVRWGSDVGLRLCTAGGYCLGLVAGYVGA